MELRKINTKDAKAQWEYTTVLPANENDGNAVKALALFIREHGKKELLHVMDRLHQKYDFQKIQEIFGYETEAGLNILKKYLQRDI